MMYVFVDELFYPMQLYHIQGEWHIMSDHNDQCLGNLGTTAYNYLKVDTIWNLIPHQRCDTDSYN